jgi:maltooligosyltrehalose synthase
LSIARRSGGYEPLAAIGYHANHVIAFACTRGDQCIVIAVGRHFVPLSDGGDPIDFSHIPLRVLRRV